MNPNDIRTNILADLISRDSAHNGYYEKLGINNKLNSVYNSNLFTLDSFKKKVDLADELIKKYKLDGNDLNNKIALEELRINIDLIFKPKGIFSFFK